MDTLSKLFDATESDLELEILNDLALRAGLIRCCDTCGSNLDGDADCEYC